MEPKQVVTVEPTATLKAGLPPATACGDTEICDPCSLLLQAIEEGLVVIIANKDHVTMVEGSLVIDGSVLATGMLSETTNE